MSEVGTLYRDLELKLGFIEVGLLNSDIETLKKSIL